MNSGAEDDRKTRKVKEARAQQGRSGIIAYNWCVSWSVLLFSVAMNGARIDLLV